MKYWTLLNKGYNSSRIFGTRVHFATEPSDSSDDASGASGGGSGDNGEPTIDELKEALAKAQGERDAAIIRADKNKRSLDTALKDLSAEKKKNRESLSADQIAAAEKQELLDRIAELETQTRTSGYTKRLMGLGIAEDKASSLASLLPPFAEEDNADAFSLAWLSSSVVQRRRLEKRQSRSSSRITTSIFPVVPEEKKRTWPWNVRKPLLPDGLR